MATKIMKSLNDYEIYDEHSRKQIADLIDQIAEINTRLNDIDVAIEELKG